MAKKTPWFPVGVDPMRTGVYERKHPWSPGTSCYAHWNGSRWGAYANNTNAAHANRRGKSGYQDVVWRGLAGKP